MKKLILLLRRGKHSHGQRIVAATVVVAVLMVGGGFAAAATGHPGVLRYIPVVNGLIADDSKDQKSAPEASHSPAPKPSSTPEPTDAMGHPVSGGPKGDAPVTQNGNVYGVPGTANEPSVTYTSNKPLVLSQTNFNLSVGQNSGTFTAKSPDGYPICGPSGSIEGTGLGVASYSGGCATVRTVFVTAPTKPGVYTLHIFSDTETKVLNGRYIRYDGYLKITVTAPPSFWLSADTQHIYYAPGGGIQSITANVVVTLDAGYSGNPNITYQASSNNCASVSFNQSGPNTYTWGCVPTDPNGHGMYTLNFYGNDGLTSRSAYTGISY